MQGVKEVGSYSSSSSSSTARSELFGSKPVAPSSSSSRNAFSSIFPPPSKVRIQTEEFPKFEVISARKQYTEDTGWSIKPKSSVDDRKNNNSEMRSEQKDASRTYQEQNSQPSNLSSSIFYGGRETYSHPNDNRYSASDPFSSENGNGKDDSGSASRGDWWQGSLYY